MLPARRALVSVRVVCGEDAQPNSPGRLRAAPLADDVRPVRPGIGSPQMSYAAASATLSTASVTRIARNSSDAARPSERLRKAAIWPRVTVPSGQNRPVAQPPVAGERSSAFRPRLAADQQQGQLIGENLVISQPFSCFGIGRVGMDRRQRLAPRRPAMLRLEARLNPFG